MTKTNEKIKAIEAYTESTVTREDGQRFEMENGSEWLVLDDAEADELTRDEIENSLWAFNPDFIIDHLENQSLDNWERSHCADALSEIQRHHCEGINPIVRALIGDMDDFVADAIALDGREHFLARYDDREIDLDGTDFYAYRTF